MIIVDGVEMIDVREAARLADRTPETVRRWVWSGRLPARKQGNRLLVPIAEVRGLAPEGPREPAGLTLRDWARAVTDSRVGEPGRSAADLVAADRAGR